MTKLHQYDKPLFGALLLLNIGSGITTIRGAMQIFPDQGVGFFSGLAIQAMLFLLLSRLATRHWITQRTTTKIKLPHDSPWSIVGKSERSAAAIRYQISCK